MDVLCWWTLGISSPFYLMSGFFAAELVRSRGLWQFVKNRGKRIVGPFVAAGVTILPITFFVWVAGWLISGQCTPREILRMKFHAPGYQDNLYGPCISGRWSTSPSCSLRIRRPGACGARFDGRPVSPIARPTGCAG